MLRESAYERSRHGFVIWHLQEIRRRAVLGELRLERLQRRGAGGKIAMRLAGRVREEEPRFDEERRVPLHRLRRVGCDFGEDRVQLAKVCASGGRCRANVFRDGCGTLRGQRPPPFTATASRTNLIRPNIGTSCLVPGMTTTNIGRSEEARPEDLRNQGPQQPQRPLVPGGAPRGAGGGAPRGAGGAQAAAAPAPVNPLWQRPQDPLMVGRLVVDGILHNDLFIFPAPEYRQGVLARGMAMVESMVDYYPMPDNIKAQEAAGRYYFTDIFVQEIAHRRATRKRSIKGFEG